MKETTVKTVGTWRRSKKNQRMLKKTERQRKEDLEQLYWAKDKQIKNSAGRDRRLQQEELLKEDEHIM